MKSTNSHFLARPPSQFILRWILGLAFIYASWHKIADPAQFAKAVYGYGLFPSVLINPIAILLPFVELVCGLALFGGIAPRGAALVLGCLLVAFILIIGFNWARGHQFDCGCFSIAQDGPPLHPAWSILRNMLLLSCAGGLLRFSSQMVRNDQFPFK